MKKITSILLCITTCIVLMSGCNNANTDLSEIKINIVCTIYPAYDWVNQLIGENADQYNVQLLLDSGTDLHSYQPSAKDIITITGCDLFVYVGGASDAWVHDVLSNDAADGLRTINMLEVIGNSAYKEELVDGMEAHHDDEAKHSQSIESHHNDEADNHNSSDNHDRTEYDEHVWLSLRNAITICNDITEQLIAIDPSHADDYQLELLSYTDELTALDTRYKESVGEASFHTLLFGDRFPFRYLVEDYELDYYAAFAGCSAETEASFQTIVFLANKVDELGLPAICVTESSDQSVAGTILENTKNKNADIVTFNSLQSVTVKQMEDGISYFSIMEDNLTALKEALK